jgi:uncharacterized protein (DUF433 family)
MHGVSVFRGTRVPVQTLFEYLEGDETLEDFRRLMRILIVQNIRLKKL